MSAASPLPPPYPSSQTNGGSNSSKPAASNGGERVFAHIDDLKAEALTDFNPRNNIGQLISRADAALGQAKFSVELRRPDRAFVDYLRACEIVVVVLPSHRDYIDFIHDQNGEQRLSMLRRKIHAMTEQFEAIKQSIIANNRRFGVQPHGTGNSSRSSRESPALLPQHKTKPTPSPKPDKLHGRPLSVVPTSTTNGVATSSAADVLSDRFAKLRGFGISTQSPQNNSTQSLTLAQDGISNGRLLGPRDMPSGSSGPPLPLKIPLDTSLSSALPKPPSPTYSPARNMQTSEDMNPPRHTARSLASQIVRKPTQLSSSASAVAPNGSSDYFGSIPNYVASTTQSYRRDSVLQSTRTSAEMLYDYLERFELLIIDFRPREEFDLGHIWARNVICIDPFMLHRGMSAEEVDNKLVISPEDEQHLWHMRDKFQLVVYYDTSTQSPAYLTQPANERESRLKYLHEALCDFNQDKPLQRTPMLLVGGLEAWIDLLGKQALQVSSTQVRAKVGRPIQRRPLPPGGHSRLMSRKNRDYNPLNVEEEQKWRDRAMSESVPQAPKLTDEPGAEEDGQVDDAEQDDTRYPTIEDFNARFPEAGSIGRPVPVTMPILPETIVSRAPPIYPTMPRQSVYPQAPTRPAPAAPRTSYTGVSDRAVAQAPPTPRTTSQLMPYIPAKLANLRLPRVGLRNFGNTCYMNATLQALSATTPLTMFFMDDGFRNQIQTGNWKSNSKGILSDLYSNFLRTLWKTENSWIEPDSLQSFCGRMNSQFKNRGEQQDAQEFFSFIIDELHEDFNVMWSRTPLRELTEQQEMQREKMPRIVVAKHEWARYTHRENSFITSLFFGQQSSRLQCSSCGATSTQFDSWALLPVEIPDTREIKLQDCLRQYFKEEHLDEANQWTCPRCKVPRQATKKLTITRAPPFLVMSLSRFRSLNNGGQRKVHTTVRFPLEGLDIGEFVLPQPAGKEAEEIIAAYGPDALKCDATLTPPYIYDLYAVVRHLGQTTRSGHYITAVRDRARGCWRLFDDKSSQDFSPEKLRPSDALDNDQAYMLFFQRRLSRETR